ncbi:MAG: ComEC/Rec2 family competence protein, partial [Acidimicrobiia bacterium]
RRAVVGLLAVAIFVVATRWEPSVVRASVMAALVLLGRIGGWALDAFSALAATVVLLVVVSGELATDVGFTLSVLATLGVLVGTHLPSGGIPHWLGSTLTATVGAQLAVAPVLIAVFGSIPLLAPVTNLLAAPLVAVTTTVATVGVGLGMDPLIRLAALGARGVLEIARFGAGWPQLGWIGFGAATGLGLATTRRATRPLVVVVAAVAGVLVILGGSHQVPRPGAVVLDVGQGDSILVVASNGSTLLVDGGPEAALLERKLSEYGVTKVDLLVLTHVHADHATGLEAVVGRRPVGEFWFPTPPHSTPSSEHIAEIARRAGLRLRAAPVGTTRRLGDLWVEVLGPVREYASPNDQSAVLLIHGDGGPRLLLTGDAESYAQADLAGVKAEVLKVPHQGAATSDLDWLASVGAELAVIPVGPNDYGHPSPEVIATLESHGTRVLRTDRDGDVVVSLR